VRDGSGGRRVGVGRGVGPRLGGRLPGCRLEVDVAGHLGRDQGEGTHAVRKALLPVGSPQEARRLLRIALPDTPPAVTAPPRPARWKAPLSYHFLAAGHDATLVVAVTGRVRRETTWVALAKTQSVRLVQGPLQRMLGLAPVPLAAAGRRVRAEFRERRQEEARALVTELAALSRTARKRAEYVTPPGPVRPAIPAGAPAPGDGDQAAKVAPPV